MTIREWINDYKAGKFDSKKTPASLLTLASNAQWSSYMCHVAAVQLRQKGLAPFVTQLKDDYILDNFTIKLKNESTVAGSMDSVLLFPNDGSEIYIAMSLFDRRDTFGNRFHATVTSVKDNTSKVFNADNKKEICKFVEETYLQIKKTVL